MLDAGRAAAERAAAAAGRPRRVTHDAFIRALVNGAGRMLLGWRPSPDALRCAAGEAARVGAPASWVESLSAQADAFDAGAPRPPSRHKPDCTFWRALSGPVAIECEHGYDVCPICDPCTCQDAAEHAE